MTFILFLKKQTQRLSPVYFALIMATGIISIACHLLKLEFLSNFFFYLNNLQYGLLLLLLFARILIYPHNFVADFTDSSTGPGFLTFIAGSCILGVQYCLLKQTYLPAIILWLVGLVAWIFIVYAFFLVTITKPQKPSLENGLNGGWLLLVVSTQSLSILGTQLSGYLPLPVQVTLFFTLAAYLLGLFFYLLLMPIIFFRLNFDPMSPKEFTPPYWVIMGAVAITTLSGATLVQKIGETLIFTELVPFLKGLSLLAWTVASWWIPLLIILEIWRHLFKKVPLKYEVNYWDTVFTLGMYTVCTFRISTILKASFLDSIPQVFIYLALAAWLITFLAMIRIIVKRYTNDF